MSIDRLCKTKEFILILQLENMRRSILITVIVLIGVGASAPVLMYNLDQQPAIETQASESFICADDLTESEPSVMPLSYDDDNLIRSALERHDIQMSSSLKFSGEKAAEFCSFFADGSVPAYCTSTELVRSGEFLGNIHMVGTADEPSAVLGVVRSDAMPSGVHTVVAVTDSIIKSVFECTSGTSALWIGQLLDRHTRESTVATKSTMDGLPTPVLLELTGTSDNHLWTILIGDPP